MLNWIKRALTLGAGLILKKLAQYYFQKDTIPWCRRNKRKWVKYMVRKKFKEKLILFLFSLIPILLPLKKNPITSVFPGLKKNYYIILS